MFDARLLTSPSHPACPLHCHEMTPSSIPTSFEMEVAATARTGAQAAISASQMDQRLLLHRGPHRPRPSYTIAPRTLLLLSSVRRQVSGAGWSRAAQWRRRAQSCGAACTGAGSHKHEVTQVGAEATGPLRPVLRRSRTHRDAEARWGRDRGATAAAHDLPAHSRLRRQGSGGGAWEDLFAPGGGGPGSVNRCLSFVSLVCMFL
jgi:hypothetical protein